MTTPWLKGIEEAVPEALQVWVDAPGELDAGLL